MNKITKKDLIYIQKSVGFFSLFLDILKEIKTKGLTYNDAICLSMAELPELPTERVLTLECIEFAKDGHQLPRGVTKVSNKMSFIKTGDAVQQRLEYHAGETSPRIFNLEQPLSISQFLDSYCPA